MCLEHGSVSSTTNHWMLTTTRFFHLVDCSDTSVARELLRRLAEDCSRYSEILSARLEETRILTSDHGKPTVDSAFGNITVVYKWYIMPIGWLYTTHHLFSRTWKIHCPSICCLNLIRFLFALMFSGLNHRRVLEWIHLDEQSSSSKLHQLQLPIQNRKGAAELGIGFKLVWCLLFAGEMLQFEDLIFQMGWSEKPTHFFGNTYVQLH